MKNQRITGLLTGLFCVFTDVFASAGDSTIEGRAMGMVYRVVDVDPMQDAQLADARKKVLDILSAAESTFSLYRIDSEIALWNTNRSTDWIPASNVFLTLVEHSRELSKRTGGAFDPTIRPVSKLWRFDKVDNHWTPPTESQLAEAMQVVGMDRVELRFDPPSLRKAQPGVELDLNALVEGWCIDRIVESLEACGRKNFLVHLGGEYAGRGGNAIGEAWSIAIESPSTSSNDKLNGATGERFVELLNECISTSGNYRSGHMYQGKWYGHILDARTGYPFPRGKLLSSVVAESALTADGIATAMLTMDGDSSMKMCDELGLASLMIADDNDGSIGGNGPSCRLSKKGEIRFRKKDSGSIRPKPLGVPKNALLFVGGCSVAIVVALAFLWTKRRRIRNG